MIEALNTTRLDQYKNKTLQVQLYHFILLYLSRSDEVMLLKKT